MEKIIEIDLHDKYDLVEKYNENKISNELIKYIIKEAIPIRKNEKIKIVINVKCNNINRDCKEQIDYIVDVIMIWIEKEMTKVK